MNELSLVRLKIQELRKELLELEMEERRLVQEEKGKNKYIAYLGDVLYFNINYLYFEQYA